MIHYYKSEKSKIKRRKFVPRYLYTLYNAQKATNHYVHFTFNNIKLQMRKNESKVAINFHFQYISISGKEKHVSFCEVIAKMIVNYFFYT